MVDVAAVVEKANQREKPAHQMRIMGGRGDTRLIWDPKNKDEVKSAQRTFDELAGKGYRAYGVTEEGKKGELIEKFDKNLTKIIMARPMAGG